MTLVIGTALTLGLSQLYIINWAASGMKFPVRPNQRVVLPYDDEPVIVYYESPHSIPSANCRIYVTDPYGDPVTPRPVQFAGEDSFRIPLTGWSGRAIAALALDEPGEYKFTCTNANFRSDAEIPAEDRVVLLKSPQILDEVRTSQKVIKILGGTVTIALAIMLYVVHGLSLRRTATAGEA